MRARVTSTLLLLLLLCSLSGAQSPATTFSEDNRKEAQRLWDLAVEAKGGRDKLKSVKSIAFFSNSAVASSSKTWKARTVDVYLFPWKWWHWDDQRDRVFGIDESMYNSETGKNYLFDPRGKTWPTELKDFELPVDRATKGQKMTGPIVDLLVLNWIEPSILGVTHEKNTDVVHVALGSDKYDFAFDPKTHLTAWYKVYPGNPFRGSWAEWTKDYKDFDGLMMPTHVGPLNESGRWTYNYEFNVAIDDSIWEHPPAFELGADGWRKRN